MSIWQTKSWQKMLKKSGQVSDYFEVDNIYIEKRSIWFWDFGLFILWLDKEISKQNVNKLIELCKKENCLFLQIETINYNNNKIIIKNNNFTNNYYKKFITPYTAIINFEKTQDEILANMKPKWRYNIKLAIKKWVVAEIVEKTEENIKAYYELMLETISRDKFSGNSLDYYNTFLNSLENSKLILARKDWIVIAGWIFTFGNEVSIYYYWASTSKKEYRNFMAPYLVQWVAIEYAKSINSKIYDFLWVASPDEKNSELAWVTDFKKKLTKDIIEVSNSSIFINKKIKYFIINILRIIKNTTYFK